MTEYPPEPWHAEFVEAMGWSLVSSDGLFLSNLCSEDYFEDEAMAHRIAACVNACSGLGKEALEDGIVWRALRLLRQWVDIHDEEGSRTDTWHKSAMTVGQADPSSPWHEQNRTRRKELNHGRRSAGPRSGNSI